MKLKVSLELPTGACCDITIACDVATTVSDVASAILRSGRYEVHGSRVPGNQAQATAHATLVGSPGGSAEYLLDPLAPLGMSGLQSGWRVRVAGEFDTDAARLIPATGIVEVLNGKHQGTRFSLVSGRNTVGRDPRSRVRLRHRSVSRRHAVVEADERLVLRDLGSANGTEVRGERVAEFAIARTEEVQLGTIRVSITPFAATWPPEERRLAPRPLGHRSPHTRAPRVDPRFAGSTRELPAPQKTPQASRPPVLAMLAPMLMGGAMFAITGSAMSLVMVALTPLMMVGSWLDGRLTARRAQRREDRVFSEALESERAELAALRAEEIAVRATEVPETAGVAAAMRQRGRLLWARRPEHGSFLELRLGDGELSSRTETELPKRAESPASQWEAVRSIAREFANVAPVPVTERMDRCGSIGIAGTTNSASGLARSLVVQLTGLHSPAELALAAITDGMLADEEWNWLKWLPHTDAIDGKTPGWQLSNDEATALRLLIALEGIAARRRDRGFGGDRATAIRSTLPPDIGHAEGGGVVSGLPRTPVVVVLVVDSAVTDAHRPRLIALAEQGPDLGMHFIWVANEVTSVPAACRTFVEWQSAGAGTALGEVTANFVRQRRVVPLSHTEHLAPDAAAALARAIAPVADTAARALDESDLPHTVQLRDVHAADLVGGAAPLLANWRRSGSLVSEWRIGSERTAISLAAVVGQGPEGPAVVDLRKHGPHALVGGTTGSGKSEFLQSWIMSLAANLSPDRLTFLLVDYKGGAAFAECVDLPHTVGLVTDLSPHLVRRALTSLRAELRRREELLSEHGAKDLIAMEQRSDPAAPPVLVIVIDEFAALARDVPEFVDGVIDIAQRGRSLGLHLVMATQRPAGVVTDNLRANTNLRIALRMADAVESGDVLGVPDAAFFDPEAPGRAAMKVGAGRVEHFQTGYVGGRANSGPRRPRLEIRTFQFAEGEPWTIREENQGAPGLDSGSARDIEQLRDALAAAALGCGLHAPRKPWLETLPALLTLESLSARARHAHPGGPAVGLVDLPEIQAQEPVRIDFDETGNLAVFGASGTGKTTALLTLAAALTGGAESDPVHLYAVDAAGGSLGAIRALPTVGAVAQIADSELTERVLRHVSAVVADRTARFAAARANGLPAYRSLGGIRAAREARVMLFIDGFSALAEAADGPGDRGTAMAHLSEIMRAGRAVGVHVVLTAERAAALPSALAASVQQRLVLRLASANEYSYLDVKPDALDGAVPGRCVFAGQQHEIQLACAGSAADLAGQAAALESLAGQLEGANLDEPVRIRNAPDTLALSELPGVEAGLPVYGIDSRTMRPVGVPPNGLGVVAGPPGSGLTTATRSCVRALERWASTRGDGVDRVLLSFTPGSGPGGDPITWDRRACGEDEAEPLLRELIRALGGTPPADSATFAEAFDSVIGSGPGVAGPGVSGVGPGNGATAAGVEHAGLAASSPQERESRLEFPLHGCHGVIVVERPCDAVGSTVLSQLVELARVARRASVLVLFEFEQGSGVAWELHTALKQPNWGIALQPDEYEGQTPFRESFGRVTRAAFAPGRGFAVERGRITPVQVGVA